jgi:glycosyltransferase involved in cell wall biosynthesis
MALVIDSTTTPKIEGTNHVPFTEGFGAEVADALQKVDNIKQNAEAITSYSGRNDIQPLSITHRKLGISQDTVIKLSIVIPIKDERDNVIPLYTELSHVIDSLDYPKNATEIIFVDDGSTDGSTPIMQALAACDPVVQLIIFRRNYGQTAALSAGFRFARGEIIITLDGDLQNDPADIPRLLAKMAEGYDLVSGWRRNRQDKMLSRRLPSIVANRLINKLIEGTNVQLHDFGCTLKAYKKGIVKNIRLYGEMHRFIPVFAAWLGVNVTEIEVHHRPRVNGVAKYNLSRVTRVIFDLIVVRFFADYLTRPIQFFGKIAKKLTTWGLIGLGGVGVLSYLNWLPFSLDTIFLSTALLLMGALQIVLVGLLGEILVRSYFEGQDKDPYVIKDIISNSEEDKPCAESLA